MKLYLLAALVLGLVSGSPLSGNLAYEKGSDHGTEVAQDGYGSEYESKNYGDEKCYPTYETKYKEQCEDYYEKVCYTTQNEQCGDVKGKKCKAIQSSKQERKCYDVQELLCSLKEHVQYEEVPAVFTVQKCHKVTERVCDTVYDTELTERDEFRCINVVNPHCASKEYTVYDKTCRTITHFDCQASAYGYNDQAYGEGSHDSYAAGSYGDSTNQQQDYKCKRTPETKCYTTPRTVSVEYCEDREEKVCEKLTERVPIPSEKQNCHDEHKKVCELEQRSQPKQVKKYVYTKHCRPVPKTVCDNIDHKFLQPSCVPKSIKNCRYSPEEKCENIPKQHCFKIPYQVKKMECNKGHVEQRQDEKYGSTESYANDHQGYSDDSFGSTGSYTDDY